MYAVINTFNGVTYPDGEVRGRIVSRHRKASRAIKALHGVQRAVKRANGQGAYLPLAVVEIAWEDDTHARGALVDPFDFD